MGNFQAIQEEEKVFKMQESRNDIIDNLNEIEDVHSQWGQDELKELTERFEETFAQDSDDEDGISDKDVIYTKLPWATVERQEDKTRLQKECRRIAKKDEQLCKLKPHLEFSFDFDLDKYTFLATVMSLYDENLD